MPASSITTILFDLDGTLLPIDQNEFIHTYFTYLAEKAAEYGYEKEPFLASMWKATGKMIVNDGSRKNMDAFWDGFTAIWGEKGRDLEKPLESFYANEFNKTKSILKEVKPVRALIDALKAAGFTLCLATNPLFPPEAIRSRLDWIGLVPEDFVHVTTYDNSTFCKPQPGYYREILALLGKQPQECLMIGNNPSDDMSALQVGIDGFLITDHLENEHNMDISQFRHGDFNAFLRFMEERLGISLPI